MATPPSTMRLHADPDPELLLAHSAWIRALARKMAGAEAEDLVQDTWLAVLERPRADVRSLRSWLGGLVANLAREKRRGEARRRVREERTAGGASATPSVAETVEAAATGRELADLVLALEEPFRSVVLLRYYEDLPPRRIARVLGVPVRTVNSRLTRGLERLRERWKQRERAAGRDGEGWARSLLFLAGARPALTAPAATCASGAALSLGVLLMNAKIWLGLAVVGAGAMAWWLRAPRAAQPHAAGRDAVASPEPGAALASVEEQASAPRVSREERRAASEEPEATVTPAEPATPATATRLLRGRVVDADALPLAGIEVGYHAGSAEQPYATVTSGAQGVFELQVPRGGGQVRALDPSLVTVMRGIVDERTTVEPLVVVAPRVHVAGTVVDELGAPLGGVHFGYERPPGFRARFEVVFDTTEGASWNADSDEQGRFDLGAVPAIEGAFLVAELGGFEAWRGPVPWHSDTGLEVVLARTVPTSSTIAGRVADPEGRPVPGAWVSLGGRATATDAAGEFRLERGDRPDSFELTALKPGYMLARLRAEPGSDGKPAWPDWVVLELGGAPLALAGRIVDAEKRPRTALRVWIADPTLFGVLHDDMTAGVEYFLGACAAGDAPGDAYFLSRGVDEEGRFRIEGLLEREYTLAVIDEHTLEIRTFGPFGAGDEALELEFAEGALGRIAGRLVDRDGRGLAGIDVQLMGNTYGGMWTNGGSGVSDADGSFAFERVGGEKLLIAVSGDDVVPLWSPVAAPRGREVAVEIAVAVRCHFLVDLGTRADRADELRVLDGDGAGLTLFRIGPGGTLRVDEYPIVAGRSDSLGVDERARTLVLYKAGVEVERIPLALRPGILNLVTP